VVVVAVVIIVEITLPARNASDHRLVVVSKNEVVVVLAVGVFVLSSFTVVVVVVILVVFTVVFVIVFAVVVHGVETDSSIRYNK
jgi:hypothetical protein